MLSMVKMTYDYESSLAALPGVKVHNPFIRCLEAGYSLSHFLRLFNSMPRAIKDAIDEGMEALCALQKLMLEQGAKCERSIAAAAGCSASPTNADELPAAPAAPPGGLWVGTVGPTVLNASCFMQADKEGAADGAAGGSGGLPSAGYKRKRLADLSERLEEEGQGRARVGGDVGKRQKDKDEGHDDTEPEDILFEHVRQQAARHGLSDNYGAFCFDWDPETGRRKNIYVTDSLGRILDMHTEEFLARAGSREHLPYNTDTEFLARMLTEILGPSNSSGGVLMGTDAGSDANAHYMKSLTRIIVCDPTSRKLKHSLLARVVAIRELDMRSNVVRTINMIDPLTVEQFDELGAARELLVRDDRTGQDLLADASKDYLFNETSDGIFTDSNTALQVEAKIKQKTQRLEAIIRDVQQRQLKSPPPLRRPSPHA